MIINESHHRVICFVCIDFIDVRHSCFQSNNLKDLFKDVSVERILSFLK